MDLVKKVVRRWTERRQMGKLVLAFVIGLMVGGIFGFFFAALMAVKKEDEQ